MASQIAKLDKTQQMLLLVAALLAMIFLAKLGVGPTYPIRSVSAPEAKRLIDGGALVVDVRGPESYSGRHIPGAISVPLDSLRQSIPAELTRAIAQPVVVYCGDGVSIGPEGTALLNKQGFRQAVNLEHGIQGWADAGYSVVKPGA